jgi:hypothetical protein
VMQRMPLVEREAAAAGTSTRRPRALLNAAAAEGPAAEEPAAAEGAAKAPAAEGAPAGVCKVDAATLWKGEPLGSGTPVTGDAAKPSAAEAPASEAPASEAPASEAPASAEASRRLKQVLPRMPQAEAEGVGLPPLSRRSLRARLLLETAVSYGTPVDSGEPTLPTKQGGPCAGHALTPTNAHPMDNQDVTFVAARAVEGKQYFRVIDMFTPSRAKPLPDYMFCQDGTCGTDDIVDAIGAPPSCASCSLLVYFCSIPPS